MASWYKIKVSAKLTVRANNLKVRKTPQMGDSVRTLQEGAVVQATERL